MANKEFLVRLGEKEYPCTLTYKRMRSITYRLSRDGKRLLISAPYFVPLSQIKEAIPRIFPKLIAKVEERPSPILGDDVYLFGVKTTIPGFHEWAEKKKDAFLKKELKSYLDARVPFLSAWMKVPPYQIKVRTMVSRYGVNNIKNKTLTFATILAHYDKAITDYVIVHELAHHYERNHQKGFYDIVARYCPDYKKLRQKLKKGEYQ